MNLIISKAEKQASFFIEEQAYPGVKRIMQKVMKDMTLVTGKEYQMTEGTPTEMEQADCIVAATLGKSEYLEKLASLGKIDLSQIRGKRENYIFQVIEEEGHNTLVIAGSDKRGTIYGLFHLSEFAGVSPWVWFADVVPAKKDSFVLDEKVNMVSKEPSVKYRGFFINDEWPSFGNWTFRHFGGFKASMYEHVFELLLRLKGNYLWPAMWTSNFSLDGPGFANAQLADELGIVMSNSHHEPCLRHSEEWDKVKGEDSPYGTAWNFDRNKEGLTNYWRDGLKRNGHLENIITMGMRGERDSEILGRTATLKENIDYLKEVITTQNELIRECVNPDLEQVPRMLALYKEVEAYFYGDENTPGLKDWEELDGITFMLCDDNFANVRTLPEAGMKDRAGGWGMYYHFDYHGDPISYEWVNSTYLPKVWEQMTMAYEFGIRDIWIVNVGDLKPQELPLSYFMDLAYDYDKWGVDAVNMTQYYTRQWVEQQFGGLLNGQDCDTIFYLLEEYTRINSIRKPEALAPDTYHPVHYGEADKLLNKARTLVGAADELLHKMPSQMYAAFYELVYYPVAASMNQLMLQLYAGKNSLYAKQGRMIANQYAELMEDCLKRDEELQNAYHSVADGKWDGMMLSEHVGFVHWNDEECRYPVKHYVTPSKRPRMIVAPSKSIDYSMGGDWTRKLIPIYDFLNKNCDRVCIDIANGSSQAFEYQVSTGADWVTVSPECGNVELQESIELKINRQLVKELCEQEKTEFLYTKVVISSKFAHVDLMVYARAEEIDSGLEVAALPESLKQYQRENELGLVICAQNYVRKENSLAGRFELLRPYGKYDTAVKAFPITSSFVPGKDAPALTYEFVLPQDGEYEIVLQTAPSNPISTKNSLRFGFRWNQEEIEIHNTVSDDYRGGERSCEAWASGVLDNIHELTLVKAGKKGSNELTIYACDPAFVLERILIRKTGTDWKKGYMGPVM
ncbi:MAG: hypothetical protein E7290_10575 [Lachnospiraceae bacterium]|nr:hypothetical protein [Lachnospiraceae bacterium]